VTERQDLQRWIAKDPGLLGEPLLVISSEFSRFDRSHRRLDILALDRKCNLVVIELKLDASRSLADQQAIRYAALCSDLAMGDVVAELARFECCTVGEAEERVRGFLDVVALPGLGTRPRIILAAGDMEDHELRSSVLWLRGFGMDISCIELTPYRASDPGQVILVPRTVIPAAEITDAYSPDAGMLAQDPGLTGPEIRSRFWRVLADEFNRLETGYRATGNVSGVHMRLRIGLKDIHYEWIARRRTHHLDVALHLESDDRELNLRRLESIESHRSRISQGVLIKFETVPWGKNWAEARFRMPYQGRFPPLGLSQTSARAMKLLIERTGRLVQEMVQPHQKPARRELSLQSISLLARVARMRLPDHPK